MNRTSLYQDLIKEQFIKTIDSRIAHGSLLIDEELSTGIFDIFAKPIVQAFYNSWSKDSRRECIEQVEIVLDIAKNLTNEDMRVYDFISRYESEFNRYLKGDQFAKMSNHKHGNYPELENFLKKAFISQIKSTTILLRVEQEVEDYKGLVKNAFNTKKEAHNVLTEQLDLYDECLNIIKKDTSILKFPAGRKRIFKVLQKGAQESRAEFMKDLNTTFD
ncbi:MAG: hypothetical protein JW891_14565 [Candidatus Lokiarchaeota archaeon]|nr:hypothetical protein [Candidatus Lokiarchaeota archaeon]